jgi:hypothetical protein
LQEVHRSPRRPVVPEANIAAPELARRNLLPTDDETTAVILGRYGDASAR